MDVRTGTKRLAIALGVPWFGFWGLVAILNYDDAQNSQDPGLNAVANERVGDAIFWGLIAPLLLLLLAAAAYWIYRGFMPRQGRGPNK